MITEMTVCEKKMVEIPDLPADVMKFIEINKGIVCLRLEMEVDQDTSAEYAELWVTFDSDSETLDSEEETFHDRLAEVPGFDENKMQDNFPWFQSCAADGYPACELFVLFMKKTYSKVKFI